MDVRLGGRVALITGGSKGIGLAIATRIAASGADVALLARRPDVLEEARRHVQSGASGKVHAVACDVADAQQVAAAFAEVVSALGRVDILVNNAGTSQTGAFPSITDAVWQVDLDLKLFAAIRLARLCLARNDGAPLGADHQRAEHRREGAQAGFRPPPRCPAPPAWR